MEYRFTGIMLRKREVGETDRFYTFFSREQGKVTAIAKGVRKAEAKLASSLETATLAEIMVARTRGMGKITGAVLEQSYPVLHQSYETIRGATRFFVDVDRLVEVEEKDEALFVLLKTYLETAEHIALQSEAHHQVRLVTEAAYYQFFALLGYQLTLNECGISHERLREGGRFFVSFNVGGIVSETHVREVRDAQPISENAIKVLRLIVTQPLQHMPKVLLDAKTLEEIAQLRSSYRRWIRD
ncbi:MAG: DNA repair protein RecO [Candidatus Moraniibacteriota bacterium]